MPRNKDSESRGKRKAGKLIYRWNPINPKSETGANTICGCVGMWGVDGVVRGIDAS